MELFGSLLNTNFVNVYYHISLRLNFLCWIMPLEVNRPKFRVKVMESYDCIIFSITLAV